LLLSLDAIEIDFTSYLRPPMLDIRCQGVPLYGFTNCETLTAELNCCNVAARFNQQRKFLLHK